MSLVALFATVTKLAGALASVTVAGNAFSFSRYRKKNLRPFRSPIDESSNTLADFNVIGGESKFFFGLSTAPGHVEDKLNDAWLQFAEENPCDKSELLQDLQPVDALLGSATGSGGSQQASLPRNGIKKRKSSKKAMKAMVRRLEKYVEGEKEKESASNEECGHNVAAWHNVHHPEERLRFWSDPDIELKLAKNTGISVFRMGVDWSRIMHKEPINGFKDSVNYAALERYKWIINRVRSYGMKVNDLLNLD